MISMILDRCRIQIRVVYTYILMHETEIDSIKKVSDCCFGI